MFAYRSRLLPIEKVPGESSVHITAFLDKCEVQVTFEISYYA